MGVDDGWLAMDDGWTVDPDAGAVSLKSDFLAMLGLGEHTIEMIFSEPEMGVARAKFVIVEPSSANTNSNGDANENGAPIPDTGVFTGVDGGAQVAIEPVIITAILLMFGGFFIKKRGTNFNK